MFVDGAPVPVSVDGGVNTIFIRPKMDFGAKNRAMDALAKVTQGDEKGEADVAFCFGGYQIALLTENVLSWSGPAFGRRPCDAAQISRLDPDEPLVVKVLEEIALRNPLERKGSDEEEAAKAAAKKDGTSGGEPLLAASG